MWLGVILLLAGAMIVRRLGSDENLATRLLSAALGCTSLGLLMATAADHVANLPISGFTVMVITLTIGSFAFAMFAGSIRQELQSLQQRREARKTNFPEIIGRANPEADPDELERKGW